MAASGQVQSDISDTVLSAASDNRGLARQGLTWGDKAFLVLVVLALVAVVLSGRFAYHEASLLQQAKDNGVLLLRWANAAAAASEGRSSLPEGVCLDPEGGAQASDTPDTLTWTRCREQLWGEGGPWQAPSILLVQKPPRSRQLARKGITWGVVRLWSKRGQPVRRVSRPPSVTRPSPTTRHWSRASCYG